jgi:hypothetical protein
MNNKQNNDEAKRGGSKVRAIIGIALLCAVILFSFMAGRHSVNRYEFKTVGSDLFRCNRSTGEIVGRYFVLPKD